MTRYPSEASTSAAAGAPKDWYNSAKPVSDPMPPGEIGTARPASRAARSAYDRRTTGDAHSPRHRSTGFSLPGQLADEREVTHCGEQHRGTHRSRLPTIGQHRPPQVRTHRADQRESTQAVAQRVHPCGHSPNPTQLRAIVTATRSAAATTHRSEGATRSSRPVTQTRYWPRPRGRTQSTARSHDPSGWRPRRSFAATGNG